MPAMATRPGLLLLLAAVAQLVSAERPREAAVVLPEPGNVKVTLVNFYTELSWKPGVGTPEGTRYTVQFRTYGKWERVIDCSHVASTRCNLTKETAGSYPYWYNIRLRAVHSTGVSRWIPRKITPLSDFEIGEPEVYVKVSGNDVSVFIILPRTPIFDNGMQQSIGDLFGFNVLYLYSLGSDNREHRSSETSFMTRVEDGVRFCASAEIQLTSFLPKSNQSEKTCVNIKTGIFWILVAVLAIIVTTVCLIGLCICKTYKYLHTFKPTTPKTLDGMLEHNVPPKISHHVVFSGHPDYGLDGITIVYNHDYPGSCADLNKLFSIKIDGEDAFNTDKNSLRSSDDGNTTYSSVLPMLMYQENGNSNTRINHAFDDWLQRQDTSDQMELKVTQKAETLDTEEYCQARPLLNDREMLLSKVEQSDMGYKRQHVEGVHPYMSQ